MNALAVDPLVYENVFAVINSPSSNQVYHPGNTLSFSGVVYAEQGGGGTLPASGYTWTIVDVEDEGTILYTVTGVSSGSWTVPSSTGLKQYWVRLSAKDPAYDHRAPLYRYNWHQEKVMVVPTGSADPTAATLGVQQDANVKRSEPTLTEGTKDRVLVKYHPSDENTRLGYWQFAIGSQEVNSALFSIYDPGYCSDSGSFELSGGLCSFNESTVIYNNRPSDGLFTYLATHYINTSNIYTNYGWMNFDITEYYNSHLGDTVTLRLTDNSSRGIGPEFASRETTYMMSNRPGVVHIASVESNEFSASITAPEDNIDVWYGDEVSFTSSVTGGTQPYTYTWVSDVDGTIGTSSSFSTSGLNVNKNGSSVDSHTITLTVEDANSDIVIDQVNLTIFFKGDFEPDGDVDFDDYAVFADDWLYSVEAIEGPTPTSAWWKFDEESGSNAADSSVNNNTGTLHNMNDSDWIAGKFGNALDFDGSDDYVQVADHSSMSFGTGSFSISFWIKDDVFNGDGEILINGSSGPPPAETGNRYEITNTNSYTDGDPTPSGAIVFVIDNHAAGNKKVLTSDTTFVTGDWVHCVCIRDASVPQLYIYRNAVLDDDKPGHALDIDSSGEPLYIGQNEDSSSRFQGQLDDIRFYNYVLSGDDIDNLYNASPAIADSPANFNDDEIVDFEDLAEFTEDWLETGY